MKIPKIDFYAVITNELYPTNLLSCSTDGNGQYNGGLDIYKSKVQINSNGKHTWLNSVVFQKICKLDVSFFPFDDQECALKFGSWAYDETKIITKEFANTSSSNSFYIPNGEWELLSIHTKENLLKYQCCEHRFSDVTVTIRLRRQAKNHTLTLILPCALLSSLVVLGFILPPESGERIGLSITVLLSVTVFQQLTSQIMPPYDFPYLAQYYLVTIMQTAFSLVSSTLILNIYHRSNRRMPNWTKKLLLGWLAPVLFFQCSKQKETINSNSIIEDEELSNGNTEAFHAIKISKNKVDNSYMNSVIQSLEERNKSLEEQGNNDKTEYTDKDLLGSTLRKKASKVKFFSKTKKSSTASAIRSAIHHTAFPLLNQKASESIEEYELVRQQEILKKRRAKDWLKAARVLDRFFFILYVIVSTTTLLAIFLRAPRFSQ